MIFFIKTDSTFLSLSEQKSVQSRTLAKLRLKVSKYIIRYRTAKVKERREERMEAYDMLMCCYRCNAAQGADQNPSVK